MRVCWDEDEKMFLVIPSLDDIEEIKRLGVKHTLPDVVVAEIF